MNCILQLLSQFLLSTREVVLGEIQSDQVSPVDYPCQHVFYTQSIMNSLSYFVSGTWTYFSKTGVSVCVGMAEGMLKGTTIRAGCLPKELNQSAIP